MMLFTQSLAKHDANLAKAQTLGFRWHWLVGFVLVMIGFAFENWTAFIAMSWGDWLVVPIFAIPAAWFSLFILMPLLPAPYAALAKKLD